MSVRKRFDEELFQANDRVARDTMLWHLGEGWVDNPDKYGPDLLHEDLGQYAEVEIKRVWKGVEFPWDSVQLPQRKAKWQRLRINYYILNKSLSHAVKIPVSELKDEYLKMIPNRFVPMGEMFYQIPIDKCKIVELKRQPLNVAKDMDWEWQACTRVRPNHCVRMEKRFQVVTKDGVQRGKAGDYLMRDLCGGLYVCRAEVFEKSYEFLVPGIEEIIPQSEKK